MIGRKKEEEVAKHNGSHPQEIVSVQPVQKLNRRGTDSKKEPSYTVFLVIFCSVIVCILAGIGIYMILTGG